MLLEIGILGTFGFLSEFSKLALFIYNATHNGFYNYSNLNMPFRLLEYRVLAKTFKF